MSTDFDRDFLEFAADAEPAPVAAQEAEATTVDEPTDEPALDSGLAPVDDAATSASTATGADDAALLREQLEQERRAREKWEAAARSDAARVAALQRKYEAQAQKQALSQSALPPVAAPHADAPLQSFSPEVLEGMSREFPEIAAALNELAQANAAKVEQQAQQIQQLHEAVAPLHEQQQVDYLASQYEALSAAHPDWQTVVNTGEFNQWLQQQPVAVHSILASDSAADSAWLLSQYKQAAQARQAIQQAEALQSRQAARTKKLSDAVGVSSRVAAHGADSGPSDFESAFRFYAQR